jgi:arylsulfate sulfotransferase
VPTYALEVASSPTIELPNNGLLARVLHVSTDVPTRPSLRVMGPGEAWTIESNLLQMNHEIPLMGFTFGTDYTIDQLQFTDAAGETIQYQDPLSVSTEPAPANLPLVNVRTSIPEQMEPGLTLFAAGSHTLGVDAQGVARWHYFGSAPEIYQAGNGLFYSRVGGTIREFDLLANDYRVWHATGDPPSQVLPISKPVQAANFHHDVFLIESSGNILTLAETRRTVDNFPLSNTDPNALGTVEIISDAILEFDSEGNLVHNWDLADILDPRRGGYGLFRSDTPNVADWSHSNGVLHDPTDDSIIVSVRNQDAVIKFDRTSGELKWILGPHEGWGPEFQEYLLTPLGDDFEWPYHTHSPMLLPNGNLMVHDNGNFRARPFDPLQQPADSYTRGGVEFAINEETMEVSQVWQYGKDAEEILYTPIVGDADWQPQTDNVLMTYGFPQFINGEEQRNAKPRIIEVNRDGEVVFDLELSHPFGNSLVTYRAERIPSLYGPEFTMTMLPLPLDSADYDGNGQVEQGDLDLVLLHWGQDAAAAPAAWVQNRPTGAIDQAELDLVLLNWGATSAVGAAGNAVPEPATWLVAVVAVVLQALTSRNRIAIRWRSLAPPLL